MGKLITLASKGKFKWTVARDNHRPKQYNANEDKWGEIKSSQPKGIGGCCGGDTEAVDTSTKNITFANVSVYLLKLNQLH